MSVQILTITGTSDGDDRRRPKTDDFTRNDAYWLERVANIWAKDRGLSQPGVSYRLDRLPDGYGGYEKARGAAGGDSNHIDRYVYGHARGVFRSLPEFYPHFKWLVEHDSALGCNCKLCSGKGRGKAERVSDGESRSGRKSVDSSRSRASSARAAPSPSLKVKKRLCNLPRVGRDGLVQGRPPPDPPKAPRKKQVDEEGTPDALRLLIDKLKAAGARGVEESIIENLSPDWRAGHDLLFSTLRDWKSLPSYVPRQGELVMFVRQLGSKENIEWDRSTQTWRGRDTDNAPSEWNELKWEAGVVTQMPTVSITDNDLGGVPADKQHSVIKAGFRIEPLSQPNSVRKLYTKQHKYVYLNAIRPLCMWKECVRGLDEADWHPTIRHALAVTSSFCLVGRYYFKGIWPKATIFCSGIFIGPELVMLGDAVRLHPRAGEQAKDIVTDVIVITAIKMRIVNLDEAGDDDQDDSNPYAVCIHVSGKAYTQDPSRSFDGIGKMPIPENSDILPPSLQHQGTWYYMCDPKNDKARIEVPYHRIIGRCYPIASFNAWFESHSEMAPLPSSFQAVNQTANKSANSDGTLSRGLLGIMEGRVFSQTHDCRIDTKSGRTWFWADSRLQQLDLYEINGIPVGVKDERRSRTNMGKLRRALELLDGKKGGFVEHPAASEAKEQGRKKTDVAEASASDCLADLTRSTVGLWGKEGKDKEGKEEEEREEEVEEGEKEGETQDSMEVDDASPQTVAIARPTLSESESESDAENALAAFKAGLVAKNANAVSMAFAENDDEGGGEVMENVEVRDR